VSTKGRCVVQDLVPGFLKFITRPTYGVVLRFLGLCFVVVGVVQAGLGDTWAGFTPVVWFLLAVLAFLGVICNLLAQSIRMRRRLAHSHHPNGGHHWEAPKAAETPVTQPVVTQPVAAKAVVKSPEEPKVEKPADLSWFEVEIYCVKCREQRMVRNPETVTLSNGRPAYRGSCPVCGTKVSRIRKAE
jgi:hypothetical protein